MPVIHAVTIENSLTMNVFYKHSPLQIVCNTGANTPLIHLNVATRVGMPIHKTRRKAYQADGTSELNVCDEVSVSLSRGSQN